MMLLSCKGIIKIRILKRFMFGNLYKIEGFYEVSWIDLSKRKILVDFRHNFPFIIKNVLEADSK